MQSYSSVSPGWWFRHSVVTWAAGWQQCARGRCCGVYRRWRVDRTSKAQLKSYHLRASAESSSPNKLPSCCWVLGECWILQQPFWYCSRLHSEQLRIGLSIILKREVSLRRHSVCFCSFHSLSTSGPSLSMGFPFS